MKTLLSAALLGAGLLAQTAHAEIVTYEYSGSISRITQSYENSYGSVDSAVFYGANFALGQSFTGRISWDTDSIVQSASGNNYTFYAADIASELRFGSGGLVVIDSARQGSIGVNDYLPGSRSDLVTISPSTPGRNYGVAFGFIDSSATVFTDTSVPTGLDLADFDSRTMVLNGSQVEQGYLNFGYSFVGNITSLTRVAEVPEPSMAWLLLGGLGALGARRLARRG